MQRNISTSIIFTIQGFTLDLFIVTSTGELMKAERFQAFLILHVEEAQWWNTIITETKTCRLQIPALRPLRGKKAIVEYSILQYSVQQCHLLIFPELNILAFFLSLYLDHTTVFFECKGLAAYWNEGVKEERTMDNEELVLSVLRRA